MAVEEKKNRAVEALEKATAEHAAAQVAAAEAKESAKACSESVLVDVGSGYGKAVVHFALEARTRPAARSRFSLAL